MMTATIFDIERSSFVDGPGIRTTVFFKGCNLRCVWCHNPESQSAKPELAFFESRCTHCGKCKEKCPNALTSCTLCGACATYCPTDARKIYGKEMNVDEVMEEILRDRAFYENSGGGVTFSGGECMLQIDFLEEILKQCKEQGIHTAVDTAGHVPYEYFERILPYTDLFLYDVKAFDSAVHQQYTGVGNERILENLQTLLALGAPIWVRIPTIPTVNASVEEMKKIKAFLDANGAPRKVELLPYHAMGEGKCTALGKAPVTFPTPDAELMANLRAIFA